MAERIPFRRRTSPKHSFAASVAVGSRVGRGREGVESVQELGIANIPHHASLHDMETLKPP